MRVYLITLSHITSLEGDEKFKKYIDDNKFDWWRYIPIVWGVATPDNVSTNMLTNAIVECYGIVFCSIIEVKVMDVGGLFPVSNEEKEKLPKDWTPFKWFINIRDSKFIPRWEREK